MLCHNIIYIFIVKNEIIYLMQKNGYKPDAPDRLHLTGANAFFKS
jgi:hypothetical protein